jgi:hypothetical protein
MVTNKEKNYVTSKARTKSESEALKRRAECGCGGCVEDIDHIISLDMNGRGGNSLTFPQKKYLRGKCSTRLPGLTIPIWVDPECMRDFNEAMKEREFPTVKRSSWVKFWDKWHLKSGKAV